MQQEQLKTTMFLRSLSFFPAILAILWSTTIADDPCDRWKEHVSPYCEVLEPYVSSPRQQSLELLPGDNVTLHCQVEQTLGVHAAGAIWMGWIKDNTTASVHLGKFTYSEKNAANFSTSHALTNARPHDSGTYVCQAKSTGNLQRGNATGVHVTVAEPQLETPNITADVPSPGDIDLGLTVKLRCETQAYPHALFNWTKDGRDISTNHSAATDHMIIGNFSQSDDGLYACVAWNMLGEKLSQELQLTAKPPDGGLPMLIIIAVASGVAVFVVVTVTATIFVYRRRRQFKHCRLESESDEEEGDFSDSVAKYDSGVHCCEKDRSWTEKMVNKLEKEKLRVYFSPRDDIGGGSVFQYLSEGIAKSRNVIIVFSNAADSDEWFKKGYQTAVVEQLDRNLRGRVIPVLMKGFERTNLPLELKDCVALSVEDPKFFERLLRSLSKDSAYESDRQSSVSTEEVLDTIIVL
ncbi:PREDICTED: hemicentin-2-like [Branchiostoma belcheri]|uniref:Hemicentin-2-like n=1 Tax=Branchiostoma belcheri TaxID=7741 RepID=A0A6P4ZUV0_BRABE|nr:PREDICTED: hemicentin-2-like [Branchiostoma belcheri]